MKRTLLTSFFVVVIAMLSLQSWGQGTTTATMSGKISGTDGGTLPGATILATDMPSGTQYGTTTDANGFYRIANMNVGGPYRIVISYVGYETLTKDNIYLSLGQTFKLDASLSTTAITVGNVEVVALKNDIFDGNRTGAETTVTMQAIEAMPTVGRNFSDYTRLTPQAKVDQYGGVQIAGTNNRYNSIYIDGAVNNDVFGLTSQGTNGGQTGISPFSMDILDQISIQVAPYDVKLGGFSGAGINAVTRRGTNEFSGSAYYITRNEGLAGLTPTDDEAIERTKLADFSSNTYGFRIGGPIVKDKLFFFLNAEIQQDETPQPFDFSTYNGTLTQTDLDALSDKLINDYGYNPGGYTDKVATLDGNKFFARLDWNINKVHRLMIRHQYTKAEQYSPATSSTTAIRFANAGIYFPSTTNTTAIELKSNLSSTTSNNLILGFTSVRDDRNPMGDNFPYVRIKDGASNVYFGSEEFSTANRLYQDIITLTDNFEIYKGKHTITLGTHNEFYSMYNLFVRQNFGSYQFDDLATFMNGGAAYQYDHTFSAVDNITGDGSAAAADFDALQIGLYAQDEIQINDKLKVTAGLRIDVPMFLSTPTENVDFNENVIPILEAEGWDLEGAKTGQTPDASIMFNPRIGFNYDVYGDKSLQIRGGAGIFTSRIPYVWPGASFQNNAVITGGMRVTADGAPELIFNPDWNNQPTVPVTQPSGQVDIFAKDFKFPQVFRASLAADKKLPWGVVASFEAMFTKNISNVMYYNLRYVQDGTLTGADNRPIYRKINLGTDPITGASRAYTDIIFGTNTSEGYGYNFTAQLQKNFNNGLTTSLAYTYGDAYSMNDGVSSQNSSQWRVVNVRGKNDIDLAKSDFAMGHRIVGYANYKVEYLKSMATSISLFYNGQSGDLYSYGYADGSTKYLGEDNQSLELLYIPATSSDINLVDITDADGVVTSSAADQWEALDAFIKADEYLNANRGSYAERNSSRVPFVNLFDLRIAQDFYVKASGKKNTIQVALDIFNLGNLLNKNWGRIYYASGAYYGNYPLVKVAGFEADGTTPKYTFTAPKSTVWAIDDSGLQSSRWQGQLTIRYIFN